jgi:hypothetical protein
MANGSSGDASCADSRAARTHSRGSLFRLQLFRSYWLLPGSLDGKNHGFITLNHEQRSVDPAFPGSKQEIS